MIKRIEMKSAYKGGEESRVMNGEHKECMFGALFDTLPNGAEE
jgi:hypothetical protein